MPKMKPLSFDESGIRRGRLKLGFSQTEMARLLGICRRHYQKIEQYESLPNAVLALAISLLLRTTVDDLWGWLLETEVDGPEEPGELGETA